jgi:hypothetical protein
MFTAVLFTIVKLWNQPRYSSTDEYMKKIWYTYRIEYYSVINKNVIMSFEENGLNWKSL